LNNLGVLVGNRAMRNGTYTVNQGFIWDAKAGYRTTNSLRSQCTAINDKNLIVGNESNMPAIFDLYGNPVSMTPWEVGVFTAVNNNKEMAGTYMNSANNYSDTAFFRTRLGGVKVIAPFRGGWSSYAEGMNSAGWVVGYADDASGQYRPLLWDRLTKRKLPSPKASMAYAYSINDSNVIVGAVNEAGTSRAAVWSPGPLGYTLSYLQTPASFVGASANAISVSGTIVGTLISAAPEPPHAFVALPGQGPLDLNLCMDAGSPACVLIQATAVNSKGQIAGLALANGTTMAFLATPVQGP
jgi:uncharacterized membrane protein